MRHQVTDNQSQRRETSEHNTMQWSWLQDKSKSSIRFTRSTTCLCERLDVPHISSKQPLWSRSACDGSPQAVWQKSSLSCAYTGWLALQWRRPPAVRRASSDMPQPAKLIQTLITDAHTISQIKCCTLCIYRKLKFYWTFKLLQLYILRRSRFFYVLNEVSYAHEGCIYLIKNTEKKKNCEILLQFKITGFYFNILWKIIYFCDQSWIFSINTPVFSVMILQKSFYNDL